MDAMTFDESKARLEEIADMVEDPEISLDDALKLYEEAVRIGLHACDVSEQDILGTDEARSPVEAEASGDAEAAAEMGDGAAPSIPSEADAPVAEGTPDDALLVIEDAEA